LKPPDCTAPQSTGLTGAATRGSIFDMTNLMKWNRWLGTSDLAAGRAWRGEAGGRIARALFMLVALAAAGCAAPPKDYPRSETRAIEAHDSTPIGKEVAALAAQHPGESGYSLMSRGRQAFTTRVALADLAQKTLDVQYFLWEADATGRLLTQALLRAADRGVRVRILLDDVNLKKRDRSLAAFDTHANIEIRLFNPFADRGSHLLGFMTDFERVNHRMHNKLMVMDNTLAIVGGRNMSDPYFEVDPSANFRDLDIVAAGPIVRDLSKLFDRFWNGEWSVPIAALYDEQASGVADLDFYRQRMAEVMKTDKYPHPLDRDVATVKTELTAIMHSFIWAPGQVLFDDPSSINDRSRRTMSRFIFRRVDALQGELLIESAYFIPVDRGVAKIKELRERGVRIRVLTNSLASNDVIAAFAGYSGQREALLKAGVELYELRPVPGPVRKAMFGAGSKAGLHTKAIVFDRKDVFVGSFNLDARSALINTEAGLYIESPKLAAQVVEFMDDGIEPDNAFHVLFDENGKLYWASEDEGKPVRYDIEPMTTGSQRFEAGLIRMLPVAEQL
jgi:putative cardiolipin synthase